MKGGQACVAPIGSPRRKLFTKFGNTTRVMAQGVGGRGGGPSQEVAYVTRKYRYVQGDTCSARAGCLLRMRQKWKSAESRLSYTEGTNRLFSDARFL